MSIPFVSAAGTQYVRDHLKHFPRPDQEASRAIRDWYQGQGITLDPDQTDVVTLHYRGHQAVIAERMSLTMAVLSDWQGQSNRNLIGALFSQPWAGTFPKGPVTIVQNLPKPGLLDNSSEFSVFNGLFRRTDPPRFDATTHIPVHAEALQTFIWHMDFHDRYKALLDDYWAHYLEDHRLAAKINFVGACNKQVGEGSLSDAGRKLAWQAAGLMQPTQQIRVRALNIYGYAATDLLCIRAKGSDLTLLYFPGNSSPLHEFATHGALQDWVGQQCQSAEKRQLLRQHFALTDLPDGLDFSGLDSALEGLGAYPQVHRLPPERAGFTTDGTWPPRQYVNYRVSTFSPTLPGDLFLALSNRQRERCYQDGDFVITRNSDVTGARWRDYVVSALNLLAPLALVVPELAPLFALGGVAVFGEGLNQAINGKSLQAKADGVANAEFGAFNAVPLLASGLTEAPALFRAENQNFVVPRLVNDQWGYPLSPITPPRLPDIDVADYFHLADSVPAVPGGDPAIADAVIRVPRFTGDRDLLQANLFGYNAEVVYDMEHDAFVLASNINEVDPDCYIARSGSRDLVKIAPHTRQVTDTMRMNSLRALGVNLKLPFEMPSLPPESLAPLPKKIACIWVGDQHINADLIANLDHNAQRLTGTGFEFRLYLSNSEPQVYTENLARLTEQVPGLQVLPLEEQPFFATFRESKSFRQYQDALQGNGGVGRNYASASDVLRYRLLHHEGGFYMDIDDVLLAPGTSPMRADGTPAGPPGEPISEVKLAATPQGLALHPPMANEQLGMRCDFNNSMIGSHPGNPTLDAISDLMHQRYLENRDFYWTKPSFKQDPAAFNRYCKRLSYLTGPRLLTDVIDSRLPALYQLRQLLNLANVPTLKLAQFVDVDSVYQALLNMTPLNRFAKVGAAHSWYTT